MAGPSRRLRQRGYSRFVVALTVAFVAAIWMQTISRIDNEARFVLDGVHVANANLARLVAASVPREVIVGGTEVKKLLGVLAGVDLGNRGEIAFLGTDGVEILHVVSGRVGRRGERTAAGLMAGETEFRQFVATDGAGEPRAYAVARSAHGFHVAVSRPLVEVLQGHRDSRRRGYAWAGSLTLLAVAATTALIHLLGRQRGIFEALRRTEKINGELIEQLKGEKERAYHLAYYDQLTGLANRSFFRALAVERLAGSRRRRRQAAIAFMDIDRFKAINDSLGHHVGDQLLVEVARRLRASLRESDSIARFGGDEFVVQVVDVEHAENLKPLLSKIVDAVAAPMSIDGHEIQVSASLGVAIHPQDGETIDELIRAADAAMYEAKRAERGAFRFFDARLNAQVQRYSNLEQRFRLAIEQDEFLLHFQPRMDTFGYRIVTIEALVRWRHPEFGLVYPGDFIPIAEETGFIVELGAAVVDQACRQIAGWRAIGLDVPPVAINVSARQLRDDGFVRLIRDAVVRHGIAFTDLELEVTESCVMENAAASARVLGDLAELGLSVSLDDYGTGYSSLSSIKLLPLSAIKIDRSFIKDIGIDPNDDVIVASTISMSHGLGLRVVAEGVETRAQLIRLRVLGCEEVQGYLFSRPVEAVEMARLLVRGNCEPRVQEELAA